MKKNRVIHIGLCLLLCVTFSTAVTPASAACLLKIIDGLDSFTNSDVGTVNADLIFCETADNPDADVEGREGDDIILVYYDSGPLRDIMGGNVTNPGNDSITIFSGVAVDGIYGDFDTDGGTNPGDDEITVHGFASAVIGDYILTSSTDDEGGDDIIDIFGYVNNVIGDGIYPVNSNKDTGGNDVIMLHNGSSATNVYGDFLNSTNANSVGGLDVLIIDGNVSGNVMGDYMAAGSAGFDRILVNGNGDIQGNIYGDYVTSENATNSTDIIVISGEVDGNLEGDGYRGDGATDSIVIEADGMVSGNLLGDSTYSDTGDVDGGQDFITVKGYVEGNLWGDEVDGNGASDSIVLQGFIEGGAGVVKGDVVGDGLINGGVGNGAADQIYATRFSSIYGAVHGDHATRIGGNGGDDNIQIDGQIGNENGTGVFGDTVKGDGGNDFIHIEKHGLVVGRIVGDDVNGLGGQDLIWIDGQVTGKVVGDLAGKGNAKDRIAVRDGGQVDQSVIGDGSPNSGKNGGWDAINITGGTVDKDVVGDDAGGNGGNDFMAIRMSGVVGRDFIGDDADGNGGNDTLSLINGEISRDMIGDQVGGDGGDDKMNVLVSGTVKGDLIGDQVGNDKVGGDDSIFVAGKVNGKIYGDHSSKNALAGKDTIQTSPSAVIGQGIIGDNSKGLGGNDTFKINGKINTGGIKGDLVNGKGGNDNISVFSLGNIVGNVIGDDANGAGGNDTIFIDNNGKVTGNVWGDFSNGNGGNDRITIGGTVTGNVEGDRHKSGSTANGGDDTIIVEETGLVQGNVFGDNSPGNGGDDKIDIKGTVNGNVLGDNVGGSGGNDVIRIFASATVGGNVCGKNNCNNNPGDNITFLDENTNPDSFSSDTIIIAGQVLGNVIAGTSVGNSDDTIVVIEGAEIGGTVYAGDETKGDSFIYIENIINEEKTVSEVVNSVKEHNGKVTVNGATYTLDDVEVVSGAVEQIACFGMDYRMNKASDGCAARSGAEKDAIQWHLDNPGNDGRLPGLEGCAVYTYGDALRVYEIMDGAEGELVAEIWGNVLSDAPTTNELLGATADGNIALYHLASGELQVECRNLVDGKTQVRVLSDLAGTVTNAYDKS